jgi:hypothetical protein
MHRTGSGSLNDKAKLEESMQNFGRKKPKGHTWLRLKVKVKVKFTLEQAMKAQSGLEV